MEARLKTHYREKVVPEMMKQFSLKNALQVPRLVKISVNVGVGRDDKVIVGQVMASV